MATRIAALTVSERAWLAGYIDASGYLGIGLDKDVYRQRVVLSSGSKSPLDAVQRVLGLGKVSPIVRESPDGKTTTRYRWVAPPGHVHDLLTAIRPYMVVKGEQADLLLALIELPRKKFNPNGASAYSVQENAKTLEQMVALRDALRDLKRREPDSYPD